MPWLNIVIRAPDQAYFAPIHIFRTYIKILPNFFQNCLRHRLAVLGIKLIHGWSTDAEGLVSGGKPTRF